MPRLFALIPLLASLLIGTAAAHANTDRYGAVATLIKSFATSDGALGWEELDARHGVKWVTPGPQMLNTTAPDGSSFARPGVGTFGGERFNLAATGSRAGVGSVYFSGAGAATPAAAVAAGLRAAGMAPTPLRCPRDPAHADTSRGWYHVNAGGVPAALYVGPLKSGREGYTLYLDARLPPMTQGESARFVDCADGHAASGAIAATGQAALVAGIESLLRPAGTAARVAWRAPLKGVLWNARGPYPLSPGVYSVGGEDRNAKVLSGNFKTATTEMDVTATGDAAGANRFYFQNGANLPRDAVFNGLRRDGYHIAAVTCGKAYTKMSENWFRIQRAGKQPAILYRSMSVSTGRATENYVVLLSNTPPPLLPGQRHANGGGCPG